MVVTKAKRVTTALEKLPKPSWRVKKIAMYVCMHACMCLCMYVYLHIKMRQKPWRSGSSRPGGSVGLTKGPRSRPAAVTAMLADAMISMCAHIEFKDEKCCVCTQDMLNCECIH
jgi:hypothetical protein